MKQYRSKDGKEFIVDLTTFDHETAKDLEKRTGLKNLRPPLKSLCTAFS